MRRLSPVNIAVKCVVKPAKCITSHAHDDQDRLRHPAPEPNFDDWDTIRNSITPLEARARRIMRRQQSLRTRFQFRLVKLETQTTIIPIDEG
jgi:hypothetical protein